MIHFKLKDFKSFNEEISAEHVYDTDTSQEAPKEEVKEAPKEAATEKPQEEKEKKAVIKTEEEETGPSLKATLEKCVENVEEIVRLFEKDDQKLVDMTLPILDLCQTNLNFQEKKSAGADTLLTTSKTIIKELVEALKKSYNNNDPVTELIQNCNKL